MKRAYYSKTTFSLTNTIKEQLSHVSSEIAEFDAEISELVRGERGDDAFLVAQEPTSMSLPMLRELADVQASIETLWFLLNKKFGDGFSEKMILGWTEEKNRKRGYYVEDSGGDE